VAELKWQQGQAVLTAGDGIKTYPDLPSAIQTLTGADIPIANLFGWLQGKQDAALQPDNGWKADLSRHSDGRITAIRDWPLPRMELRVVLEP
jgi:outer membrane lipoprotein LolB